MAGQRHATPEYLDQTCDWAFKCLFQNHPDLLVRLLDDILQENITSVGFRNTELTDVSPHDKRVLFALLCQTPKGTILVEMQKVSRSDQRDRLPFYLLGLPRIMRYSDEYDCPVAAWCRIFRNFAIFAKSRSERDAEFDR